MSGEIKTDQPGLTGSTLYAIVLDGSGLAWNGSAFAAVASGSWATYAVPLVERTGTGVFLGTFPAGIATPGRYGLSVRKQAGGSPATTDPVVAAGPLDWSGTAPIVPSAVGSAMAVSDKTGFKLASDGLDAISTAAPTGVASNFREMVVQTWRRWFKKTSIAGGAFKTYADDGATVVTTQAASDATISETLGAAS